MTLTPTALPQGEGLKTAMRPHSPSRSHWAVIELPFNPLQPCAWGGAPLSIIQQAIEQSVEMAGWRPWVGLPFHHPQSLGLGAEDCDGC